eukprot:COSAG05_NODE_833_length_7066_cov_45.021961_6_plen_163_part_00
MPVSRADGFSNPDRRPCLARPPEVLVSLALVTVSDYNRDLLRHSLPVEIFPQLCVRPRLPKVLVVLPHVDRSNYSYLENFRRDHEAQTGRRRTHVTSMQRRLGREWVSPLANRQASMGGKASLRSSLKGTRRVSPFRSVVARNSILDRFSSARNVRAQGLLA